MANVNVKTRLPERGDIVLGEVSTKKVVFIKLSTYDDTQVGSGYEKIGVVAHRDGDEVLIAYKENVSYQYCNRAWWYLSGYTLDGTNRQGTLSFRFASNSWNENISKVISYNATTMEQLVSQLNTFFSADSDCTSQDLYADIVDGKVRIHCNNVTWQQCAYNTASNGFALTGALPEVAMKADIRRKHGGTGGEGVISSWHRALAFYRNDNGSDAYLGGRTSVQTSVKQTYPINLPTWLGTSTKNPGDFCANLRAVYGQGVEGWEKFMKSCLPVVPTDYGNMGQHDGEARTKVLASYKYTSNAQSTPKAMCAGADYCYGKSTECIPQGKWHLPTTEELYRLLDGVEYGTNSDRLSDKLNEALYRIGGTAISNGASWWSCCRCSSNYAWFAVGSSGFFNFSVMSYGYGCVPVSLYKIA